MKQQAKKEMLQHKEDLNQKGKVWEISVLDHEFQKRKQCPRALRQWVFTHKSLGKAGQFRTC